MSVWGVVVAAGSGTRFGAPKQYETLAGTRLVDHAVAAARAACDGVVLVVPAADVSHARQLRNAADVVVAGGAVRSASVRNGLAAVPDGVDIVVVHDAARPMAPVELFDAVVAAVRDGADAAVPGLPIADTVKEVDGSRVVATLDRSRLVLVQTPQAFLLSALSAAHAQGGDATDDAALVERNGGKVVVVPGSEAAAKVTTPADLERLARSAS
ncbi:MAG TPA: 2-C-methyl-D-erythritol 4-phosphate cytidylyltransferase [Acidimicrobiales bacterium]|nr:2-C-methyl-D-erythritol 4-phosphate cytidylyltransferase [Acidimicrobiales bacterium]